MGITKNHIYTQDEIEMARLFKALAHPARIAIVKNLLIHQNLNCNDLRFYIPLAQSTISGHMKVLHEAGILATTFIGNKALYQINKVALEPIMTYLDQLAQQSDGQKYDLSRFYFRPLTYISPHHFRSHS